MAKKKSKTTMPVDILALMETISDLGEARGIPAYVNLVFDITAADSLIDAVVAAFEGKSSKLEVRNVILEDAVPDMPLPADLCVVIGGASLLLGDVAAAARRMGTPAVVLVAQGESYFAETAEQAALMLPSDVEVHAGIPISDVVAVDLSSDEPFYDLGSWIVTHAPAKRLSLSDDLVFMRKPLAMEVIEGNALQNGAVGLLVFIPGADMPVITLNQSKMVLQIASIYGMEMSMARLKEIAAVVASAFGLRTVSRELSGIVPFMGWGIKSGVAYFGTYAIGRAALDYFEGDGVFDTLSEAISSASDRVMAEIASISDSDAPSGQEAE